MARLGFERKPNETLHQFAERIAPTASEVADWYCQYANARYAETLTEEQIEQLGQRANAIKNAK